MEGRIFMRKIKNVIQKYGYYLLLGLLVLTAVITVVVVGVNKSKNIEPNTEDVAVTISPYLPVLNATIYKDYAADELLYNSTLKQWEVHKGLDFQTATGSSVYSILDGKVVDVYSNVLEGSVVVVEHENGWISTYASLDENVKVKEGDSVNRGDQLGTVSSSASAELDAGAHLHFSLEDNGKSVDPAAYLNIGTK